MTNTNVHVAWRCVAVLLSMRQSFFVVKMRLVDLQTQHLCGCHWRAGRVCGHAQGYVATAAGRGCARSAGTIQIAATKLQSTLWLQMTRCFTSLHRAFSTVLASCFRGYKLHLLDESPLRNVTLP